MVEWLFYLTLKVWATLLTNIPACNIHIARFCGFVVKHPLYDASNGNQSIDPHYVNTNILKVVWIFYEIYLCNQVKYSFNHTICEFCENWTLRNMWYKIKINEKMDIDSSWLRNGLHNCYDKYSNDFHYIDSRLINVAYYEICKLLCSLE